MIMGKRKQMTRREWMHSFHNAMDAVINEEGAKQSAMLRLSLTMAFSRGVSWAFSDDGMAELVEEKLDGTN